LFAYYFEKGDGNEAPGVRHKGVASLIPLGIVLAAQNVEEVTLVKCKLLPILILRLEIV